MARRLILQSNLETLLGSRNVYYNPPTSLMMNYPAIVYNDKEINQLYANNKTYRLTKAYTITVITKNGNNDIVDKLLEWPMCSYDRHYKTDSLNHYILTLYF
jgi:hypothetical protein